MSSRGSKDRRASDAQAQGESGADNSEALLESPPDWDRMGQMAKRLMATPPDPKPAGRSNTLIEGRKPRVRAPSQ